VTGCAGFSSRLADYASDALPRPERSALKAHLGSCPDCRREAVELDPTILFGLASSSEVDETEARRILSNVRGAIAIAEASRRMSPAARPARRLRSAGGIAAVVAAVALLHPFHLPRRPDAAASSPVPAAAAEPAAASGIVPASATIYEWNTGADTDAKVVWIVDRSLDI
jgi:anti-sigma factor RsiW